MIYPLILVPFKDSSRYTAGPNAEAGRIPVYETLDPGEHGARERHSALPP